MTKKRLIFEVSEEVHARLKAEAAALGTPLGSHCAALLTEAGSPDLSGVPPIQPSDLDTATISSMPLDLLRQFRQEVVQERPTDWKSAVNRINTEISRRFRV